MRQLSYILAQTEQPYLTMDMGMNVFK